MAGKGRGNHQGDTGKEFTGQQTVDLSSYEARRMAELESTVQQLDQARQDLAGKLQRVDDFRHEVAGRRAELVELLADKYGFDPKANYSLQENKLLVEVKNG